MDTLDRVMVGGCIVGLLLLVVCVAYGLEEKIQDNSERIQSSSRIDQVVINTTPTTKDQHESWRHGTGGGLWLGSAGGWDDYVRDLAENGTICKVIGHKYEYHRIVQGGTLHGARAVCEPKRAAERDCMVCGKTQKLGDPEWKD